MPVPLPRTAPAVIPDNPSTRYLPERLLKWGIERADAFCKANNVRRMEVVEHAKGEWHYRVCGYWRDWTCHICLPHCAPVAKEGSPRQWSWPGGKIDRTPYGVVCHELGHHCDMLASPQNSRAAYHGGYSQEVFDRAKEKAISGYEPDNPVEWFAEMFRLFVTNHALLFHIRRRTWDILTERWRPVSDSDWVTALGPDCPGRILRSLEKR